MMREQSITNKSNDGPTQAHGDNAATGPPQSGPPEHQTSRSRNQVFKSGPLFISSKGIGWTSWKKRWFILTRTSLVFFRSDPSAAPQKGGEMNLTLGGIDLNNSASVEVKPDKKLLTVFFPDGRDGRAFTLKAETSEDLYEWKTALENALAQAPTTIHAVGQNGILKTDQPDVANGSVDQQKERPPVKSMVIGRPILLALEDIDGSPSFLEKALKYIEDHGVIVEGILRQAADVEEVHRRVRDFEQGKTDFSPDEDAHVIGDCVKYILRELPSSPVPASCCNALLDAFRSDRNNRLNNMRTAILETFPEPNRRLLQRILLMMQHVASHKTVNRMSVSAVAACMSPLLLRPLLAGDCELENTHMDVAGDGSFQLLQAAAAANHAQAIIITLLEEYDNIFGENSVSPELFSDDESGSGTEEGTDDDDMYEEDDEDDYDDEDEDEDEASDEHDGETDEDYEHSVTETCSETGDHGECDSYYDKQSERSSTVSKSPDRVDYHQEKSRSPSISPRKTVHNCDIKHSTDTTKVNNDASITEVHGNNQTHRDIPADTSSVNESASVSPNISSHISSAMFFAPSQVRRRWGRTSAKKNLSMESIDFSLEDEDEIQRLEDAKLQLQNRISEEVEGNGKLQASLERRKKILHNRRLALEIDVARLQEQLQKEKDLRAVLEQGSSISQIPPGANIDEKTRIELEEIALAEENFNNLKQRLDELGAQLSQREEQHSSQEPMFNRRDHMMKDTPVDRSTSSNMEKIEKDSRSRKNEEQQNYNVDDTDRDRDRKNESSSQDNNTQSQQGDASRVGNDTSRGGVSSFGGWLSSHSSSSAEPSVPKATSRKPSKGEQGGNSTTSALSKLTNRLNFLKERRNQIASELQMNIEKVRGPATQPIPSPGKGSSSQTTTSPGKGSSSQSILSPGKGKGPELSSEGNLGQNQEDNKDGHRKSDSKDVNKKGSSSKSDAPLTQNVDQGKKQENQSNQHLDRVKSEGQTSSKSSDKGRKQDVQHSTNNRTLSR